MLFHYLRTSVLCAVCAIGVGQVGMPLAAMEQYVVRVHRYPLYGPDDPDPHKRQWKDPPHNFPEVPFLYSPDCPPGSTLQFSLGGDNLVKPGVEKAWPYTDKASQFTIAVSWYYDWDNGSAAGAASRPVRQRKACVWLTIHPAGLHQSLRYVYGKEPGLPRGTKMDEPICPRFEWGFGCAFAGFFEDPHVAPYIDVDRVRRGFWKQYVTVCPKTFNDLMRWEFGLEGPALRNPAAAADPATSPEPIPLAMDRAAVEHTAGHEIACGECRVPERHLAQAG